MSVDPTDQESPVNRTATGYTFSPTQFRTVGFRPGRRLIEGE
jgi:hypothetical protein